MVAMDASRRGFLRARPAGPAPLRPPWALADDARFAAACTRCGDCQRACPVQVIAAGDGGYPRMDFSRRGCTLCGDCAAVCTTGALRSGDAAAAPWAQHAVIADQCLAHRRVECRVCGEACDAAAIRFAPRLGGIAQPAVDAARCTGCGACVAPCPVAAVTVLRTAAA